MNRGKVRYVCSLALAILGSFGAALQAALVMTRGEAICLNEGCRIIEGLTRVPPQFINIAGSAFFLALATLIWCASRSRLAEDLLGILLLAGIAAEGVLFSYQYFVAKSFCSWCLGVCAIVVLLNLLAGLRQSLKATAIFASTVLAFAILSYGVIPHQGGKRALDRGTWGIKGVTEQENQFYLIFSWNCPHCTEVIGMLETCTRINVHMNPVDQDGGRKLAGVEPIGSYDPEVNRQLLTLLGIQEVPVLLVPGPEGIFMVSGGKQIGDYIQEGCSQDKPLFKQFSSRPGAEGGLSLPVFRLDNDSCDVTEACPPISELLPGNR